MQPFALAPWTLADVADERAPEARTEAARLLDLIGDSDPRRVRHWNTRRFCPHYRLLRRAEGVEFRFQPRPVSRPAPGGHLKGRPRPRVLAPPPRDPMSAAPGAPHAPPQYVVTL